MILPLLLSLHMLGCAPRYTQLAPMSPSELATPLPARHLTVTIQGQAVDIAYIDSGPPKAAKAGAKELPPLVFIHGLSSYMGFWERQIPAFTGERRVLALDLPGYGASGRPDAPYSPPWFAEVVDTWLGALGVEKAVLVGHSMGGQISLTMAIRYPDRVAALALSAPAGFERFTPGEKEWIKSFWTEGRAMEAREEDVRANFTTLVFNRTDEGVERLIEERVRLGKSPEFQGTSVAVARSTAGMVNFPVIDQLGKVKVPTLIVFGTEDKMIPNPIFHPGPTRAIAEAGRDGISGAKLVLIPGGGHTVHYESPDAFNTALAEFLESL